MRNPINLDQGKIKWVKEAEADTIDILARLASGVRSDQQ